MKSIGASVKKSTISLKGALYQMTNTTHSSWKMPLMAHLKFVCTHTVFMCKKLWNKAGSSVFNSYAFIHAVLAQMPFNL